MKTEQHQRKVRLINKVVDTYFDIDPDNHSTETTCRFFEWMENGDYETEKNAALFRKFSEICDIENQVQQLFSDSPKTIPLKGRLFIDDNN